MNHNSIAGVIYRNEFQISELCSTMLQALGHRAEGKSSSHRFRNVELGSGSPEVTFNERKTIWAVLDGAIHNFNELRKTLKAKGYKFIQGSQEELIVHAYEHWGMSFLNKLNGSFSLAIYDKNKEDLYIARDRFGKKPLYWYHDGNYFLFASELKALLCTGVVPQTAADDALAAYLFLGYIPQDMSPVKGVNKLLPGYYLQYNRARGISLHSYWSYLSVLEKKEEQGPEEVRERLDSLLCESIELRLNNNRELGCFVSGGIGSAGIAHYVNRLRGEQGFRTFTAGFQGENDEDCDAALMAARALSVPNKLTKIDPDSLLDELVSIIWYLDEPIADPNLLATWRLSKFAAESEVDTIFSSMGSDELLAGHLRYTLKKPHMSPTLRLMKLPNWTLRNFVFPILNFFSPRKAYKILRHFHTNPWHIAYLMNNAVFPERELARLSPTWERYFDAETFLQQFFRINQLEQEVSPFLYFDVKNSLTDRFLHQYDRLTMANGLDFTTPFLDHRLVEYLGSVPDEAKLMGEQTAKPLKSLLKGVFPDEFVNRPKVTRKAFLNGWHKNPQIMRVFKLVEQGTLVEGGLISEKWLHSALKKGEQQSFVQLWSILSLEIWFRLFINNPLANTAPKIPVEDLLNKR